MYEETIISERGSGNHCGERETHFNYNYKRFWIIVVSFISLVFESFHVEIRHLLFIGIMHAYMDKTETDV